MSAALRWQELSSFCEEIGFAPPRLVSSTPFELEKEEFETIVGEIHRIET